MILKNIEDDSDDSGDEVYKAVKVVSIAVMKFTQGEMKFMRDSDGIYIGRY